MIENWVRIIFGNSEKEQYNWPPRMWLEAIAFTIHWQARPSQIDILNADVIFQHRGVIFRRHVLQKLAIKNLQNLSGDPIEREMRWLNSIKDIRIFQLFIQASSRLSHHAEVLFVMSYDQSALFIFCLNITPLLFIFFNRNSFAMSVKSYLQPFSCCSSISRSVWIFHLNFFCVTVIS